MAFSPQFRHRLWYPSSGRSWFFSKVVCCMVHTKPYPGCLPGYYPTKNSYKLCTTFIPVLPGTPCEFCVTFKPVPDFFVRSARPCHNTRGTGTASHTRACPLWRVNTRKIGYKSTDFDVQVFGAVPNAEWASYPGRRCTQRPARGGIGTKYDLACFATKVWYTSLVMPPFCSKYGSHVPSLAHGFACGSDSQ